MILDNDGTNWADCLTEDLRCDNVDDEERQCQSYYGTPYSNISVCRSGSDGNNYWLEQQDDPDLLHVCNEPGALSCLSTTQDCGILSDDQGEESHAPHHHRLSRCESRLSAEGSQAL